MVRRALLSRKVPSVSNYRGAVPEFSCPVSLSRQVIAEIRATGIRRLPQGGRFEHGVPGNCSCIALISYIPVANRVKCEDFHSERLVAVSCKRRGFCPSCGARRIVESAALLVDNVAVLSKSPLLRFLCPRN